MSDIIDQANDRAQQDLDRAIRAARRASAALPEPCGHCLNCGDPVEEGLRWCPGGECRDDWQARQPRR